MKTLITGNIITFTAESSDPNPGAVPYTMPDGYSLDTFTCSRFGDKILLAADSDGYNILTDFSNPTTLPVVNGKSPNSFYIGFLTDRVAGHSITMIINKFGGQPDAHYFDGAFEPILLKNTDGTEYNMIPSTQYRG